jgi:hypothetical protein
MLGLTTKKNCFDHRLGPVATSPSLPFQLALIAPISVDSPLRSKPEIDATNPNLQLHRHNTRFRLAFSYAYDLFT